MEGNINEKYEKTLLDNWEDETAPMVKMDNETLDSLLCAYAPMIKNCPRKSNQDSCKDYSTFGRFEYEENGAKKFHMRSICGYKLAEYIKSVEKKK